MMENDDLMELTSLHRKFMKQAIREAISAGDAGDIPVGAVIVKDGRIIGRGHNQRELLKDPTAHAEMIAITAAAEYLKNWRLEGCSMYVTLEPCPMCASAIQQSRMKQIVFGAYDPVMGACESNLQITSNTSFGPKIDIIAPVMEEDCAFLLVDFFSRLRKKAEKSEISTDQQP